MDSDANSKDSAYHVDIIITLWTTVMDQSVGKKMARPQTTVNSGLFDDGLQNLHYLQRNGLNLFGSSFCETK